MVAPPDPAAPGWGAAVDVTQGLQSLLAVFAVAALALPLAAVLPDRKSVV